MWTINWWYLSSVWILPPANGQGWVTPKLDFTLSLTVTVSLRLRLRHWRSESHSQSHWSLSHSHSVGSSQWINDWDSQSVTQWATLPHPLTQSPSQSYSRWVSIDQSLTDWLSISMAMSITGTPTVTFTVTLLVPNSYSSISSKSSVIFRFVIFWLSSCESHAQ